MTPTLYLRPAVPGDVDTIFRWRRETAEWLAGRYGTDQWSTPYPRERVEAWVADGATVMASLEPSGPAVATITSTPDGDPALWTPAELAIPGRYLAKANVCVEQMGHGIGETLIRWASAKAAAAGVAVVRLDVWSTNKRLQDYYRRLGFAYLRTVPDTVSGALFEGPAVAADGLPVVETGDLGASGHEALVESSDGLAE